MKLAVRLFYLVPCAALLFGAVSNANADSVNGSVWENGTTSNVPAAGSAIYSTTPTGTFTVSNPNPANLFSFSSSTDNSLNGFLTAGGDTVVYNGSSNSIKNDGINNDLFQFNGITTLANGTYTFGHDDGLLLYLDGNLVINQGGPTSYVVTDFTVCASGCDATAGTYNFTLDYAEVSGPPADLITNLPLSATPEPSSLVLLGTGLLTVAGVARRRFKI